MFQLEGLELTSEGWSLVVEEANRSLNARWVDFCAPSPNGEPVWVALYLDEGNREEITRYAKNKRLYAGLREYWQYVGGMAITQAA